MTLQMQLYCSSQVRSSIASGDLAVVNLSAVSERNKTTKSDTIGSRTLYRSLGCQVHDIGQSQAVCIWASVRIRGSIYAHDQFQTDAQPALHNLWWALGFSESWYNFGRWRIQRGYCSDTRSRHAELPLTAASPANENNLLPFTLNLACSTVCYRIYDCHSPSVVYSQIA